MVKRKRTNNDLQNIAQKTVAKLTANYSISVQSVLVDIKANNKL
jgi:hypothetical protein